MSPNATAPRWKTVLCLSLAVHATLLVLLKAPGWLRESREKSAAMRPGVRVEIREVPSSIRTPAAPTSATSAAKKPRTKRMDSRTPRAVLPTRAYAELFPDALELIESGATAGVPSAKDRAFGAPTQDAVLSGEEVAGKLDIPLVFRQRQKVSRAIATLKSISDSEWIFVSIDGDPLLRAVIFEALSQRKHDRAVQALIAHAPLGGAEVTIVLRQTLVISPDGERGARDAVRWEGGRLVVERMIFTAPAPNSAEKGAAVIFSMPLPDEEAERARRRDASHLTSLESSPAYASPIRNRAPKRS